MRDRAAEPTLELVHSDPERAWPLVVKFASDHPEDPYSSSLLEEFVYEYDARFVGRMEDAARSDPIVMELICQAYVGGIRGGEAFRRLQSQLRRELGWPDA